MFGVALISFNAGDGIYLQRISDTQYCYMCGVAAIIWCCKAAQLKSMNYVVFSPIILNGASKCCIQHSDPLVESCLFRLSARLR